MVTSLFQDLSSVTAMPTTEYGAAKVTMTAASYIADAGDSNEYCSICIHFRYPAYCTQVLGLISPRGWCKYFFQPPVGYK